MAIVGMGMAAWDRAQCTETDCMFPYTRVPTIASISKGVYYLKMASRDTCQYYILPLFLAPANQVRKLPIELSIIADRTRYL